jgi:DNA-binding FadR family transcriptional regulator
MTSKTTATRTTFQEQVLDQLGRDICAGRYKPGEALPPEGDLCERFAFSRIVIREAVKSLAAKGMLDVRRKVGTVVMDPAHWNLFDPDIMAWRTESAATDQAMQRDLLELRRIVEPAAAALAARRASGEDRKALRLAYRAMEQAVNGHGDYVSADLDFHATILKACGNQFVRQMQEAMNILLKAHFEISAEKPGGPAFTLPMHEAVCRAIEDGDEAAARQASLRLLEQAEADFWSSFGTAAGQRTEA